MYKHCLEWFVGLWSNGAENVPLVGPPALDTKVWSHSKSNWIILLIHCDRLQPNNIFNLYIMHTFMDEFDKCSANCKDFQSCIILIKTNPEKYVNQVCPTQVLSVGY